MPLVREGDEGQVDGVEHQLDGHEDGDDVALDEKGGDADREEDGAEDEVVGDGTPRSVLLSRQRDSAEDSDEDEDRGDFKGQQQIVEEHAAEVGGGDQSIRPRRALPNGAAAREKDIGQQAEQRRGAGKADDVGGLLPWVRSSSPALSSMMTKVNSTMMAPE